MITLEFYRNKQVEGWQGFLVEGHSGFAAHGEDIVCAAVSALAQTAVLGIQEVIEIDCLVEIDEADGLLLCLLPEKLAQEEWKQAQLVLKVLYTGLSAIEEEYGKHVSVKEVPYRENESAIVRFKKRRRKH
ncbi:MAG: ribosomal-processing cysteine protease Prp [Firmicutes bacterium]|nr:ribosomal-processing cysteine protease Prp [Bacillota bacterium]